MSLGMKASHQGRHYSVYLLSSASTCATRKPQHHQQMPRHFYHPPLELRRPLMMMMMMTKKKMQHLQTHLPPRTWRRTKQMQHLLSPAEMPPRHSRIVLIVRGGPCRVTRRTAERRRSAQPNRPPVSKWNPHR
jgi:hypothetical protein